MKLAAIYALAALTASTVAFADVGVEELAKMAKEAYAQREYNAEGMKKTQEAIDLYAQAISKSTDPKMTAALYTRQSEAIYFMGSSVNSKQEKINAHLKGIEAGKAAMAIYGVTDVLEADADALKEQLSAEELQTLADAVYQMGANLGQWGQANGITQSIGKWPELRDSMQLILNLDLPATHQWGANRIMGRGYDKIPGFLGGSSKKAQKLLSEAMNNTLANGQKYSVHGSNNLFYAEFLAGQGQKAEAKALLMAFIQADANTLLPDYAPENRLAQRDAQELVKGW